MPYITKSGDTWDGIAKVVYGSELCADILMAANPDRIAIFRFDSGVTLNTPEQSAEKKAEANGLLPPWKK